MWSILMLNIAKNKKYLNSIEIPVISLVFKQFLNTDWSI